MCVVYELVRVLICLGDLEFYFSGFFFGIYYGLGSGICW